MRRSLLFVPLLALSLAPLTISCATVDRSLAGRWHGYRPYENGADATLARNLAGVTLTLEASGRFSVVDGGLPLGGEWRRDGERLTFDVQTLMDRPLATQPEAARKAAGAFTGRIEGDRLVFRGLSGPEVRLERAPDPAK